METRTMGRLNAALSGMSSNLLVLLACTFLDRVGEGFTRGVSTNFMVSTIGLSGTQVMWMTGIREIPGLLLIFIAVLLARMPLSRQASLALVLMGIGYALYAAANSFTTLVAVSLLASIGFHTWFPMHTSLGLALSDVKDSGRTLGLIASVGALASILGMALTAVLAPWLSLRAFHVVAGAVMASAGLLVLKIPASVGLRRATQPRLLLRRRYWLYYVLTFFEGSRTQVFHAFGTLILVQQYGLTARDISLLLTASAVVNFALTPYLGRLLDVAGERTTMTVSYLLLALCFVGYATVHNPWFLSLMLIGINLLVTLHFGLASYLNRIAPRDDLTPSLNAGVSINHITAVSMSLLTGTLLARVGYETLCWGAVVVVLISVPFALMLKVQTKTAAAAQGSAA